MALITNLNFASTSGATGPGVFTTVTASSTITGSALYVNGGAAPTSTLYGIGENGSAMVLNVPSGDTFLFTIGGSPALYVQSTNNPILISTAAHAIEYPNNGNTGIRFVGSGASISTVFTSGISDSASAVAYLFNTGTHTLATPGALLLSVQNNGTEAFSVDYSGNATAKQVTTAPVAVTVTAGAGAVDWSASAEQTVALAANTTLTFSNAVSGQSLVLVVTDTGSGDTITLPTGKWVGGSQPAQTSGGTDIITCLYVGTTYYYSIVQDFA